MEERFVLLLGLYSKQLLPTFLLILYQHCYFINPIRFSPKASHAVLYTVALILVCILSIPSAPLQAQTKAMDSIQLRIPSLSGEALVDALSEIETLREETPDSTHLASIIALADSISYPEGLAKAQFDMVRYLYWEYQFEEALLLNDSVVQEAARLGLNELYGNACFFSSGIGIETMDYAKAHKYAKMAYIRGNLTKDEGAQNIGLSSITLFFAEIKQYKLGLEYANKTINFATRINDKIIQLDGIAALILLHRDHGEYYAAIESYNEHFGNDDIKDPHNLLARTSIELNIIQVFNAINQSKNALIHAARATQLNLAMDNDPWVTANLSIERAEAFRKLGLLDSVYHYLVDAESLSTEHDLIDLHKEIGIEFSAYYKLTGDYALQLHYLELAQNDTFDKKRDQALITFLNSDYYLNEIAKPIAEIKPANKYDWLPYLIGIIFLTTIARWHYRKGKRSKIQNEVPKKSKDIIPERAIKQVAADQNLKPIENAITAPNKKKITNKNVDMALLKKECASWTNFSTYFKEIRPGFLDKLSSNHPDLTNNELRLCGLMVLEVTTKEISQMLHVQTSSVSIAKYRLKKKLGLEDKMTSKYLLEILLTVEN